MTTDLFYNGNFKQNIKKIKGDLITYAERNHIAVPKELFLVKCNPTIVGNNVLFVCPPFKGKEYFKEKEDKYLSRLIDKFGIVYKAITYCHLLPMDRMNKAAIKSFRPWIYRITDLLSPRLIVVLGEDAELAFINQKALLRENHGKEIGEYKGAPIILTYPMDYYLQRAEYEDPSYKQHLQENDWRIIEKRYGELIIHNKGE